MGINFDSMGVTNPSSTPAPESTSAPAAVPSAGPLVIGKNAPVQTLSIGKVAPGLKTIYFGGSWDENTTGQPADLDLHVAVCDANGKGLGIAYHCSDPSFKSIFNGAVMLSEDNRDGAAKGDDESAIVHLDKLPPNAHSVVFGIGICNFKNYPFDPGNPTGGGEDFGYTFGAIKNAEVHLQRDDANGAILGDKFNLSNDYATDELVVVGELVRNGNDWEFRTRGDGYCRKDPGVQLTANDFWCLFQ